MKIQHIDIYTLNVPYKIPLKIAIGSIEGAENVVIKITTDSGLVGWGEASPCACIMGDTQQTAYQAAQTLAPLLIGKDPLAIEARMQTLNSWLVGESSLRSAVDIALYDIAAKAADMPLYQFLGGEAATDTPRTLRTDLTLGIPHSVEDALALAEGILARNFNAIKMKVGRPGLADVPHVAAVRKLAGPDVQLKIDSNQGWDFATAVANINAMQDLNLEYSEQPLAAWDIDNHARLRAKVDLPLCLDESVFTEKDALKIVRAGAADYLNIKLAKSGGLHTALKINAVAEAAGCKCMIGCFGESRLSLGAAAHLAAARPNIHFLDLDSAYGFNSDPVIGGMRYDEEQGGVMHLPDTPGHGASFDEACLKNGVRI